MHVLTAHALHCSDRSALRTQEHAKLDHQPHIACERRHGARGTVAAPPGQCHAAAQADTTQQHAAVTQARARAEASAHHWPACLGVRVLAREVLMVDVAQVAVQLRARKHEGSQRRAR